MSQLDINNWNKEDCNSLAKEVTTEWDHELKNEYYDQEYELSSHDTNWDSVGSEDADFSTESFDDLLFLLNNWSNNTKSDRDINSLVYIEMIKDELVARARANKWLKLRLPMSLLVR